MVGRPSQRAGSGRESLTDGREAPSKGGEPCQSVKRQSRIVGWPCQRVWRPSWKVGRPSRRVGRPSRKVWRLSRKTGSDCEALPEGRQWSGGTPVGEGLVWNGQEPSQRAGSGGEALPLVGEWSEMVRRPFWRAGRCRQALTKG